MYQERIRSVSSWHRGPEHHDCVFVEHDPELPGFRGLYAVHVQMFFKIKHCSVTYPCALLTWFSVVGDAPCPDTGMWIVEPDLDRTGWRIMSVVHIDTILRGAHLMGRADKHSIPRHLKHTDSLYAFKSFYVNKYIDYHAHEIAK
ncbi:hypothetical protein L208DRAFT_1304283 [Tricholoma matsutake]|nr:hypothetical protein L208DRAFT_1304283 [Tricholoma matsutake 945]